MSIETRLRCRIVLHESPKSLHIYSWVTLDLSVLFFEIKENFSKSPLLKKTSSNPGSNHARTSLIRPPYFQFLQDPGCRNEFIVILANEQTVDWHNMGLINKVNMVCLSPVGYGV